MSTQHFAVLIVGGGAAGVSVANQLRRLHRTIGIAVIEPSPQHYYQPGFTLVGAGVFTLAQTRRDQAGLLPPTVSWINDHAEGFAPDANTVRLRSGAEVSYDYLVVCPGLQLDWHKIDGLPQTLGQNGVCSNYAPEMAEYTWACVNAQRAGTALFTQPPMPIKCAGAPQKIMYLAADRWRRQGLADAVNIEFCTATPALFGVPFFAKALAPIAEGYGVSSHFNCNLVAIDGPGKTATFERRDAEGRHWHEHKRFDIIHVTPPQSAPDFIKKSPLADAAGWLEVDPHSLQHPRYANVFGLGDATCTSNAKTAAAVRKQAPVVVDNILNLSRGRPVVGGYDGYGSCPLTTALGRVMLAEFAYGGQVTPSFPLLDPRVPRRLWWWGKTTGFPWLYWELMLKGHRIDIPHRPGYARRFVDRG